MDPVAIGLVGLAVLTPALFEGGAVGAAQDVVGVVVQPVITNGQRAAMAVLRGAIAGIPTGLPADDFQALHRFIEVRDVLAPLRGPADDNPIYPAVTDADLDAIIGAFCDAVKAGNASDRVSYSLFTGATTGNVTPVDSFVNSALDSYELVALGVSGYTYTPLGQALRNAMDLRDSLLVGSGTNEDPGANMLVVGKLAIEMDQAGYIAIGHEGDSPSVLDSVGWSIGQLPTTIDDVTSAAGGAVANLVGGAVGNFLGGVLFSTPVLVGVVGYLVYRSLK